MTLRRTLATLVTTDCYAYIPPAKARLRRPFQAARRKPNVCVVYLTQAAKPQITTPSNQL